MAEFREILKTGFESLHTFTRLSAYWHHFCTPQFNARNVKWLCHFPDMWWCAATGPVVHRGRDELAKRDQEARQRQHRLGAWGWLGVASFVGVGLWAGVRWPKGMDCGVCNMAWSRLGVSEIQWE